jgi:hypothetical protein
MSGDQGSGDEIPDVKKIMYDVFNKEAENIKGSSWNCFKDHSKDLLKEVLDSKGAVGSKLKGKIDLTKVENKDNQEKIDKYYVKEHSEAEIQHSRYLVGKLEKFKKTRFKQNADENPLIVQFHQIEDVGEGKGKTERVGMFAKDMYHGMKEDDKSIYKGLDIKSLVMDYDENEYKINANLNKKSSSKTLLERVGMLYERNTDFVKVKGATYRFSGPLYFYYSWPEQLRYHYKNKVKKKQFEGWTEIEKKQAAIQLLEQAHQLIEFIKWLYQNDELIPMGASVAPMVFKDGGKVKTRLALYDADHAAVGPAFYLGKEEVADKDKLAELPSQQRYLKLTNGLISSILNATSITVEELCDVPEAREFLSVSSSRWNDSDHVHECAQIRDHKIHQLQQLKQQLQSECLYVNETEHTDNILEDKINWMNTDKPTFDSTKDMNFITFNKEHYKEHYKERYRVKCFPNKKPEKGYTPLADFIKEKKKEQFDLSSLNEPPEKTGDKKTSNDKKISSYQKTFFQSENTDEEKSHEEMKQNYKDMILKAQAQLLKNRLKSDYHLNLEVQQSHMVLLENVLKGLGVKNYTISPSSAA